MITYVFGDLFQSPAKLLVNPVNTVGIMGKGVAAEFKRYYPAMFEQYQALCTAKRLDTGTLHLYRTPHKWVLNFPTKRHWRDKTSLDMIEAGLQKFAGVYAEHGLTSASFPELSAGELDWQKEVRPLLEAYLEPLPIAVYIHQYNEATISRSTRTVGAWLNNMPEVITFDKFWRDVVRLIKRKAEYKTEDGETFTVTQDIKARARNLVLAQNGQTFFISESLLADLWTYVRGAGYILPQNLPGGLDAWSSHLIVLFSHLDYIRSVGLSMGKGAAQTGLHYIPTAEKQATRTIVVGEESSSDGQ